MSSTSSRGWGPSGSRACVAGAYKITTHVRVASQQEERKNQPCWAASMSLSPQNTRAGSHAHTHMCIYTHLCTTYVTCLTLAVSAACPLGTTNLSCCSVSESWRSCNKVHRLGEFNNRNGGQKFTFKLEVWAGLALCQGREGQPSPGLPPRLGHGRLLPGSSSSSFYVCLGPNFPLL